MCAVGVPSQTPETFSFVGCSDFASGKYVPCTIVPEGGKVANDDVKPPVADLGRVLDEDEGRPNLFDDAGHVMPQAGTFTVESEAFATASEVRHVGAGESSTDDIDAASPRFAVEGPHVVPYRESGEDSVSLPLE